MLKVICLFLSLVVVGQSFGGEPIIPTLDQVESKGQSVSVYMDSSCNTLASFAIWIKTASECEDYDYNDVCTVVYLQNLMGAKYEEMELLQSRAGEFWLEAVKYQKVIASYVTDGDTTGNNYTLDELVAKFNFYCGCAYTGYEMAVEAYVELGGYVTQVLSITMSYR